jgi:acyl dehydratase
MALKERKAAWQAIWLVTVELEGEEKPALVAEWLVNYLPQI